MKDPQNYTLLGTLNNDFHLQLNGHVQKLQSFPVRYKVCTPSDSWTYTTENLKPVPGRQSGMLIAALLRQQSPGMKPLPDVGSQFWSLPFRSTQVTTGSSPLNSQAAFPWLLIQLALSCFLASERPGEGLKGGRTQGVLSAYSLFQEAPLTQVGRPRFCLSRGPTLGFLRLSSLLCLPNLAAVMYPRNCSFLGFPIISVHFLAPRSSEITHDLA